MSLLLFFPNLAISKKEEINAKMTKVTVQMLIKKPISEVFEAFINPEITTKFWFTKSTGVLEENKTIVWEWEMYNAKAEIEVLNCIKNQLITLSWGEHPAKADFKFTENSKGTYVEISYYDFNENRNDIIQHIADNVGGFTTVLDGAKAYLEKEIQLDLISDKFSK